MANYPTIIDTFANPAGTQTLDNPDHSLDHRNLGSAIVGIENVLGTTAGTSVIASFQTGQTALPIQNGTVGTVIAKGTANNMVLGNPTVGTPNISSGTFNAGTLGTPVVVGAFSNGNISGNGTIDWSKGDVQYGTMTGAGTLVYINSSTWQRLTLSLVQDNTGGRTITLPASQYPNGVTPSFGTSANSWNSIVVIKNTAGSFLTQAAVSFS